MAAAAGAAAAADVAARRLQAHQLMMEKHFAAPIDVLKPDEHADFGRWRNAIIHRVRQIPGALTHLEDVATVTATAAPPAMGAAPEYDAAHILDGTAGYRMGDSLPVASPSDAHAQTHGSGHSCHVILGAHR